MIYNSINNGRAARYNLEEAFKLNPYINILYADNARKTLDQLKNLATK